MKFQPVFRCKLKAGFFLQQALAKPFMRLAGGGLLNRPVSLR